MHKVTRISLIGCSKYLLEPGDCTTLLKRFRHNIRPANPKMPTWKRKKILAFAAPRIPEEFPTTENIWQDCPREIEVKSLEESDKPNAFEQHYVNEVKELIDKSKMIAFFHANDLGTRSTRRAWQNSRRLGMELKVYEKIIMKGAFKDTKWENMLVFLEGSTKNQSVLFSPTIDGQKLFQFEKKAPELYFIAVGIDDRILDRNGVNEMINMPPMEDLLAQTSAILKMPIQKTSQLLGSNAQQLSTNLSQYVKDRSSTATEEN